MLLQGGEAPLAMAVAAPNTRSMRFLSLLTLLLSCTIPLTAADAPAVRRPGWAAAIGSDAAGTWADLQVAGLTQRFRWIPPGSFTMGSPQTEKDAVIRSDPTADPEWPAREVEHQVTLTQGFWLADSECTQALWQAVIGANPATFPTSPQHPVEMVSWVQCEAFLIKLNELVPGGGFRLPTEAQWEYACRAGTTSAYSFGPTITTDQVNHNGSKPFESTAKGTYRETTVAAKSLPANAWGLHEMHGNVAEWCQDWYGELPATAERNPSGPDEGSSRVIRGGDWGTYAWSCRSANRTKLRPSIRVKSTGFRIAAPAAP